MTTPAAAKEFTAQGLWEMFGQDLEYRTADRVSSLLTRAAARSAQGDFTASFNMLIFAEELALKDYSSAGRALVTAIRNQMTVTGARKRQASERVS